MEAPCYSVRLLKKIHPGTFGDTPHRPYAVAPDHGPFLPHAAKFPLHFDVPGNDCTVLRQAQP
jgi:hypothetical protein